MILITGASGFLGRHIVADLKARSLGNYILTPSSSELDLLQRDSIREYLKKHRPAVVIHAAARVGGIHANRRSPGSFLYENAIMGLELMHAACAADVRKYIQLGTICSYPCRPKTIPFVEEEMWDGYPEPTNAPYGLAKRLLIDQAKAYNAEYGFNAVNIVPTNLYGPGDNFDPNTSHVIPAIILKIDEAMKLGHDEIFLWGSGRATRDFLYVGDCANAIGNVALYYGHDVEPFNLGSGKEISIVELAEQIAIIMGYQGGFVFDPNMPEGQPRRAVDSTRAKRAFGFFPTVSLQWGLEKTVDWYRQQQRIK